VRYSFGECTRAGRVTGGFFYWVVFRLIGFPGKR